MFFRATEGCQKSLEKVKTVSEFEQKLNCDANFKDLREIDPKIMKISAKQISLGSNFPCQRKSRLLSNHGDGNEILDDINTEAAFT